MLKITSRTKKYSDAIYACSSRIEIYLKYISYALNNNEAFQLNRQKTEAILGIQHMLETYQNRLRKLHAKVVENMFENKPSKWWEKTWVKVKSIVDYLSQISNPVIDFKNSAYLVGELESRYKSYWYTKVSGRSSHYVNMHVPFETEQLRFDVENIDPNLQGDLKFDLLSKHHKHTNGHKSSHRKLYSDLMDGVKRDPLFPDMVPTIKQGLGYATQNNNLGEIIRFNAQKYNSKTYKEVAIANPVYEDDNFNPDGSFKVKVFAQIGPRLKPLHLPSKPPKGDVSYSSYTLPADGRRLLSDHYSEINDFNLLKFLKYSVSNKHASNNKDGRYTINDDWYEDKKINSLLKLYLSDRQDTDLLISMLGTNVNSDYNILKDNLKDYELERLRNIGASRPVKDRVVIPVNISNSHWVLVCINYKQDALGQHDVYYIDPLGEPPHSEIKQALLNVYPDIGIKDSNIRLQKDGYNCGPWIVEAARYFVKNHTLNGLAKAVGDIDGKRVEHDQDLSIANANIKPVSSPSLVA